MPPASPKRCRWECNMFFHIQFATIEADSEFLKATRSFYIIKPRFFKKEEGACIPRAVKPIGVLDYLI